MEKSGAPDTSEESRRQLDLLLQYLEGPAFWTSLKQENANRHEPIGAKGVGSNSVSLAALAKPSLSCNSSVPKPSATNLRTGPSSGTRNRGSPLTTATVQALRRVIHGSVHKSFSGEWLTSSLGFFPADGPLSFGLRARRHAARGLYMCLQGFVLRHLLFPDLSDRDCEREQLDRSSISAGSVAASRLGDRRRHAGGRPPRGDRERLVVAQRDRTRILARAISDMLWRAADGRDATVCMLCDDDRSVTSIDVVEKFQAESFRDKTSLISFVSENIMEFEKEASPGCILLLCSIALSRGLDRLEVELARSGSDEGTGGSSMPALRPPSLLNDCQELRSCCVNLLLAGEAAAFFHNGTVYCDNEGADEPASSRRVAPPAPPLIGVSRRADVGFLFWDGDEPSDRRTAVGSMLKTPRYPVWVTLVDGTFGLLFNMRAELVSDWHAEHQFTLCYYNGIEAAAGGGGSERAFTRLAVNTRVGRQWPANRALREEMERATPPLERCVLTKWPDADIQWPDVVRPFL